MRRGGDVESDWDSCRGCRYDTGVLPYLGIYVCAELVAHESISHDAWAWLKLARRVSFPLRCVVVQSAP